MITENTTPPLSTMPKVQAMTVYFRDSGASDWYERCYSRNDLLKIHEVPTSVFSKAYEGRWVELDANGCERMETVFRISNSLCGKSVQVVCSLVAFFWEGALTWWKSAR
ncbi:hypothetical protein Tco_0595760 [Tanacetum coccineum]